MLSGSARAREVPDKLSGQFVYVDAPKIVELLTPKTENSRTEDRRDVDALAVEDFSIHRAQSYFAFTFSPSSTAYGSNLLRRLAIFLNGSLSVLALRRTAKVVRFRALAIVSALLALKTSSRSSLSRSGVQGRRGVLVISPSLSAHLQLFKPDFSQDYL